MLLNELYSILIFFYNNLQIVVLLTTQKSVVAGDRTTDISRVKPSLLASGQLNIH